MPKIAKRVAKNGQGLVPGRAYVLSEAVKLVKERANAKFDETVEIAMNLGVDPASCRPDGERGMQPAQRFRAQAQGRGVRQGRARRRRRRRPAPTSSAQKTWWKPSAREPSSSIAALPPPI